MASGLWFTAFALAPAGPVRAVGVVEAPIAAFAGHRLFAERLSLTQMALGAMVAIGVMLAAFGRVHPTFINALNCPHCRGRGRGLFHTSRPRLGGVPARAARAHLPAAV